MPQDPEPLRQALLAHGYNPYQVHVTQDIVGVYTMGMAMRLSHAVIDVACEGWERPVLSALRNQGIRGVLLAPADFPADSIEGWPVLPYGSHESVILASLLGTMPDDDPAAWPAGKLIAVAGTHGAPGRTTLAWALSRRISDEAPVILIDGDVEAPSLATLSGIDSDPSGLSAAVALASRGQMNEGKELAPFLRTIGGNLEFLAGVRRPGRWWELPPASLNAVWSAARDLVPWTILDLAPLEHSEDLDPFEPSRASYTGALLAEADGLIIVARSGDVGLQRLRHLLDELRVSPARALPKIIIVNNVPRNRMELMRLRRLGDTLPRNVQLTVVPSFPNPLPQRSMTEVRTVCDWMLSRHFLEPVVTWMTRLDAQVCEGGSALFSADSELMALVGEETVSTRQIERPLTSPSSGSPLALPSTDSQLVPPSSDSSEESWFAIALDSEKVSSSPSPSNVVSVEGQDGDTSQPTSTDSPAVPIERTAGVESQPSIGLSPMTVAFDVELESPESNTPVSLSMPDAERVETPVLGPLPPPPPLPAAAVESAPATLADSGVGRAAGTLGGAVDSPTDGGADRAAAGPAPPARPRTGYVPQRTSIMEAAIQRSSAPMVGDNAQEQSAATAALDLPHPVGVDGASAAPHVLSTPLPEVGMPLHRRPRAVGRHRAEPTPLWQRLLPSPRKRGRHRA